MELAVAGNGKKIVWWSNFCRENGGNYLFLSNKLSKFDGNLAVMRSLLYLWCDLGLSIY